jgi:tetratricopeptide (TPR) repeat protein
MRSTTLFILLYLFACRTNEKEVTTTFVDGEQPPVKIDTEGGEREVPGFMWSPSQRKATAGYKFLVAEYVSLTGDVANASDFYKSAYNLDPNPFLAAKLIRSHASTGQLDDALPEAKKMVLLYPKSSELRLLHGQLLARKGVYYPAVKELEKSLELGPPSELAYKELIALHLNSGLSNRAIVVAEDYTKAFSNSADAWAKLSQIYFTANEPKKALIPAQRAYELQSLNPEFTLLYAIVSEMNGDRKKAVALYEQLYRLDPGNEELISRMIALYKNLGDLKDALDLLNELSKLTDEANPGVDIQRAFVLWELKRFQEASEILESLANKFPEAERLQYMKALGYEKTGRIDEAAKIYSSISEKSSFYVESQFRLMISYNSQAKKVEAESIFDRMKQNDGVTWEEKTRKPQKI